MNAKEQMKASFNEQMTAHFALQKKRAKSNRQNKKRGRLDERLGDDHERRTSLEDVVGNCDFDHESTSFGIRH